MATTEIASLAASVMELALFWLDGEPAAEDNNDYILPLLNQPRLPFNHLDLDHMSPTHCRSLFHFTLGQVQEIAGLLFLPEMIKTESRDVVSNCEALAIVLARLAYPGRLLNLALLFGWSEPALSRIINYVATFIARRWVKLLCFDHVRLNQPELQ